MKKIATNNGNILDSILPTFGEPRINTPIWDETQHMFVVDQYTSAAGHTYYLGVRFADRFVTIIHKSHYHNWTYVNDVEVYAFDGEERKLIGKKSLDTYYNEDLVRSATEELLKNYILGQMKLNGAHIEQDILDKKVEELVQQSYRSMLDDSGMHKKLEAIKPLLLPAKNNSNKLYLNK